MTSIMTCFEDELQLNFLFNIFFPKKHWILFKAASHFPVDAAMVRDLATLVTLCFVWENLVYLLYCIKASSSALFARHKSWHHHLYKTPPPPPSSQNQNQKIRYSSWHRLQFGAAQSPGQPHKKEQICNKSRDLSRFECESQFLEATFQEGGFCQT